MRYNSKLLIFLFAPVFIFTTYLAFGTDGESQPVKARLDEDGVQRVDVKVDSYYFEPNHIVVKVNKPVELRLRSVTSVVPHDFTINHPEAGLNVDRDISAGEDVKVTFTPTKTGSFEFYCDKKPLFGLLESHKDKGMKGTLEVTE
ncbi:MAG TPA: cupredoxin domain-containing protein [Thermodesulfobacteriota bacterium]|nr:cupredoxin domain-containing protein [Thermodesulfobacteriota bacterium]